jgi:hypothetical protein
MPDPRNNPTFNKNNSSGNFPGFYSRALFSYTPYSNNVYEVLQNNDNGWVDDPNFDGIGTGIVGFGNNVYHGSYILPAYYWCPGKSIRLTGDFSLNIPITFGGLGTNRIFNLRFGLQETNGPNTTIFAAQNNFNNHFLAGDATIVNNNFPIHFECTITCARINIGDEDVTFFTNGFYYYEFTNYNASGGNTDKESVYVPIWGGGDGDTVVDLPYYISSTKIIINGYGSDITGFSGEEQVFGQAYLTKLLIEELA